jgi:hypothetical protein
MRVIRISDTSPITVLAGHSFIIKEEKGKKGRKRNK